MISESLSKKEDENVKQLYQKTTKLAQQIELQVAFALTVNVLFLCIFLFSLNKINQFIILKFSDKLLIHVVF